MEFLFARPFTVVFYTTLTLLIIWARSRSFEFTPFGWNKCNGIGWRARKHTFNVLVMCFVLRSFNAHFHWILYTLLVCVRVCALVYIDVFDRVVLSRSYNNTTKYFTFVSHFALRFSVSHAYTNTHTHSFIHWSFSPSPSLVWFVWVYFWVCAYFACNGVCVCVCACVWIFVMYYNLVRSMCSLSLVRWRRLIVVSEVLFRTIE